MPAGAVRSADWMEARGDLVSAEAAASPELRIDPLSGHRTIIAGARAGRPGAELRATAPQPLDPEMDPFAEGHEDRTPPEVYALRPSGGEPDTPGWTVRVVPHLYPALGGGSASQKTYHRAAGSRWFLKCL